MKTAAYPSRVSASNNGLIGSVVIVIAVTIGLLYLLLEIHTMRILLGATNEKLQTIGSRFALTTSELSETNAKLRKTDDLLVDMRGELRSMKGRLEDTNLAVRGTNSNLQRTNAQLSSMSRDLTSMKSDLKSMGRRITHAKLLF